MTPTPQTEPVSDFMERHFADKKAAIDLIAAERIALLNAGYGDGERFKSLTERAHGIGQPVGGEPV